MKNILSQRVLIVYSYTNLTMNSIRKLCCMNTSSSNVAFTSSVLGLTAITSSITYYYYYNNSISHCETPEKSKQTDTSMISIDKTSPNPTTTVKPKLIFLGTGSSTGCPKPLCSLLFHPHHHHPNITANKSDDGNLSEYEILKQKCHVSILASNGDPKFNKNYRNNPSILIAHYNQDDADPVDSRSNTSKNHHEIRHVIIDVGKTFREGAIRWLPHHHVTSIDSVVLTHEHADAILGLDDIRGFQKMGTVYNHNNNISNNNISMNGDHGAMPIYLSSSCFDVVKRQFGYLVPKHQRDDSTKGQTSTSLPQSGCCSSEKDMIQIMNNNKEEKPQVSRIVASLNFQIINHYQPFIASGLKMIPLPVLHGEDLLCNGYAFSINRSTTIDSNTKNSPDKQMRQNDNKVNVVYLSDISRMVPETQMFIQEHLPQPIDILIVDSLLFKKNHPVHFSLMQALELVKILKPKQTFIVGINCDDFWDHDETNRRIKAMGYHNVQLAYDGLAIDF